MNKYLRLLIVFIVVAIMVVLTWLNDSPYVQGAPAGDSVADFGLVTVTPSALVAENQESVVVSTAMHNLVLVEFFAGY